MPTYEPLADYLRTVTTQTIPVTFKDIEKIIGRKLPPSAYKHRPWWSNNTTNSAMTRVWVNAGWQTEQVDMAAQRLVFRRKTQTPPPPGSAPMAARTPDPTVLCIRNLSASTLANLKARAELSRKTIEETAREVLEAHAKITTAERLQLADRVRAASPNLHHIDVPGMIREDRDSR